MYTDSCHELMSRIRLKDCVFGNDFDENIESYTSMDTVGLSPRFARLDVASKGTLYTAQKRAHITRYSRR